MLGGERISQTIVEQPLPEIPDAPGRTVEGAFIDFGRNAHDGRSQPACVQVHAGQALYQFAIDEQEVAHEERARRAVRRDLAAFHGDAGMRSREAPSADALDLLREEVGRWYRRRLGRMQVPNLLRPRNQRGRLDAHPGGEGLKARVQRKLGRDRHESTWLRVRKLLQPRSGGASERISLL